MREVAAAFGQREHNSRHFMVPYSWFHISNSIWWHHSQAQRALAASNPAQSIFLMAAILTLFELDFG
jgi:hypothetical protein